MIFEIIIGIFIALFAVIGLIIGLIKGYIKVQTWAGEYLVSSLLTISLGAIFNAVGVDSMVSGIIVIIAAVLFLLGCMGLSKLIRNLISNSFAKRDEELRKYGAVGVINRIWGGIVLAIKGLIISLFIVVPILVALDLSQLSANMPAMASVYDSALWYMIKPITFDFIVLGFLNIAIRHGFSNGISSALWGIIVFGLIVGAGFMSFNLVFNSGLFAGASASFGEVVAGWFGGFQLPEGIPTAIAQWIIVAGIFLLLTIIILLVSFFVSRVLVFARLGPAFYIVDGILGAIVLFILVTAVMLFIGFLVQPIYDLEFMAPLTSYFDMSTVARYFYQDNFLSLCGMPTLIPLRDWLT